MAMHQKIRQNLGSQSAEGRFFLAQIDIFQQWQFSKVQGYLNYTSDKMFLPLILMGGREVECVHHVEVS